MAQNTSSERDPHDMRKDEYRAKHAKSDLRRMALSMLDTQRRKAELESGLKELNAELDVLRLELIPGKMEEDGIETITIEGIGRVSLTGDMYLTTLPGQFTELKKWLAKRKLGSLVSEVVNPSTLKAFVKTRMEAGKEVPGETILKITPFTRASVTRTSK